MTMRLEEAIDAVRKLPEARQEELAEAIELMLKQPPSMDYTSEQNRAIEEGIADADAGRFATEEELERTFSRFRPS